MKFVVRNSGDEKEYELPEEIGDMFLDLTGILNSLDIRAKGTFRDSMGMFTVEIERAE